MEIVDARGRRCPQPIIDLAKAIPTVEIGEEILLLSDDPASTPDVQAWCRMTGHHLVSQDGERHIVRRAK
jgi:TusA-related sulfurtransferase